MIFFFINKYLSPSILTLDKMIAPPAPPACESVRVCEWVSGWMGEWVSGWVSEWVCGCGCVWVCGCVGVWVYGCVNVWVCECVTVCFFETMTAALVLSVCVRVRVCVWGWGCVRETVRVSVWVCESVYMRVCRVCDNPSSAIGACVCEHLWERECVLVCGCAGVSVCKRESGC